ncbi:MAG TPA: AAA family ATPase, partial [Candidatus Limnocylindria bacterium]|nr:AAA family ATPase [Candidatus Limnocylindria bacterium]
MGRTTELAVIQEALAESRARLSAVTLEGEPGIGKTRVLVAAAEMAEAAGFTTVAITADEQIHGPFLLAQSLLGAPALREASAGTEAEESVRRALDAMSGRDEPGLETLAIEAKQLRAFDLAAMAISSLATQRPFALLVDDVQWADDDTLRLLRYVVRAATDRPIFLYLAIRPDEFAGVSEAVNLVADMERMGVVRRLRLGRLSAPETGQLARQLLAGSLDPPSAQAIHSQSEGVPFIVEELVRTYRDAGLLQQLDGVWRLTRNAARLVPSAVRTLVQRRSARLPAETRAVLSDAAVVGRSFSLRDLQEVRGRIGTEGSNGAELGDLLAPAVEAGLILQHPPGVAADYTFTHEQVRDFSAAELTQSRRRQLHRALVDLMLEAGDPPPSALPLVAHHALAAGD